MNYIKYGHHISYKNVLKIIAVYFVIFIPVLLIRYPDIRNELKYFIVTDNMVQTKNYFILQYFGELYPDKPPLYFWLLSFVKNHFSSSFTAAAVTLGSTIPSFIITILSYSLFAKIKDEKTGFLIGLSLCSIPFFIGTSVFLRMDMLMTMFIFMALYFFFSIYFQFIKNNIINRFFMYSFIVLGILTKGGAGFMVPVCTIIVFLILENNLKFLKKIHFFRGIIFICAVLGLWLYKIYLLPDGKDYISLMIGQETIGRIVKSKTHIRPFYYYLTMLPVLMYPYEIFLLGGLVHYIKNIKKYKSWEYLEKIGFAWTTVPFIIFSLASGKLEIYLLPLFPGMIIMTYSFILKIKDTKIGNILLRISMICAVIPLALNKFFNKENNFYKKLIFLPVSVIIIFTAIAPFMEAYNQNYTLKPIKREISSSQGTLAAYRFSDFLNMETEVEKNIITFDNKEKLAEGIKNNDKIIVVSKFKYKKDLESSNALKLIYENKAYCLYSN